MRVAEDIYWAFLDRDWKGLPHALAALLMALLAMALLFASPGAGPGEEAAGRRPAALAAGPPPAIEVRRAPMGRSFRVDGASFRVTSPRAGWAAAARRDPGAGRRLLVLAVEVRNLRRRGFNPALLSYLLRGGKGLRAAERSGVVGPAGLGRASGLPVGARAEQRLVFLVPARLRRPVLAIQPSLGKALEVRIPVRG